MSCKQNFSLLLFVQGQAPITTIKLLDYFTKHNNVGLFGLKMADINYYTKMELIFENIGSVSAENLTKELQQLGSCDVENNFSSLRVKYASSADAQQAISRFHEHDFEGTILSVKSTEPLNDPPKDIEKSRSRSRSPRRIEEPEAAGEESAPAKPMDMPNSSPQNDEEVAEPSPDVGQNEAQEAQEQETNEADMLDKQEENQHEEMDIEPDASNEAPNAESSAPEEEPDMVLEDAAPQDDAEEVEAPMQDQSEVALVSQQIEIEEPSENKIEEDEDMAPAEEEAAPVNQEEPLVPETSIAEEAEPAVEDEKPEPKAASVPEASNKPILPPMQVPQTQAPEEPANEAPLASEDPLSPPKSAARPRGKPEIPAEITVPDGTVFELRKPNNKSPDKSVYYCGVTDKTMQMKSINGHTKTKAYLAALNESS